MCPKKLNQKGGEEIEGTVMTVAQKMKEQEKERRKVKVRIPVSGSKSKNSLLVTFFQILI
jgi:hypothetical protein